MMNLNILMATALAAASLGAAAGATAETTYIGLQAVGVNGGAITTEASSTTGAVAIAGVNYGSFKYNTVAADGDPSPGIYDTDSISRTVNGEGGMINVFISETGLTGTMDTKFASSFTANSLPTGWTVTEKTFIDAGNVAYSDGQDLSEHTFIAPGVSGVTMIATAATGAGPYSLTEEYMLTATGKGVLNNTIDISAVPEPTTWAMMLVGVSGLGAVMRSRRKKSELADEAGMTAIAH